MVSQAGFDVVVGAVHLNRLWGSGKIDYTLGQKHLCKKGKIFAEYFRMSLVNSEEIPTMLILSPLSAYSLNNHL